MRRNNIFIEILKSLSIKYTHDFSIRFYEEHPNKNNLFGLSDMLCHYNIDNIAAEIQKTQECLSSLDPPFVAYIDHDFVLVKHISAETITYSWKGKDISLTIPVFLEKWSGIVLLFESSDKSIEPSYNTHRKELLRQWIILASFVLLFLSLITCSFITNGSMDMGRWILGIVNIIGVFFCGILISRDVLGSDRYVNKICSLFLKSSDCNETLDSSASHFLGISWSVFGLGYFLSAVLSIILLPKYIIYMETLNIIALPYTLWSVWYQKFKTKQWCVLCLSVQSTVWISFFVIFFIVGFDYNHWSFFEFISTGSFYGLTILSIHFLVTLYVKEKQTIQRNYRLNSIKLNSSVFRALQKEQPQYPINKNIGILLGNADAEKWITIISNPHCAPCAKLHPQIEVLLQKYHQDVCVQVILTSFSIDLEPSVMLLIAMYQRYNEADYLQFLSDWYMKERYKKEDCYKRYALDQEDKEMLSDFQAQKEWVKRNSISGTPTILVDGYLLPEEYELKDMLYLID